MIRPAIAAILLSVIPQTLLAIDKGHLDGVGEEHSDAVIGAFSQVTAHYLLTTDGNSVSRRYGENTPGMKAPLRNAITLYLDPVAADRYRAKLDQSGKAKYEVKTTALSTILKAQYAARNKPISRRPPDPPDFVVFENAQHRPLMIEFLVEEDTKRAYVMRQKNKMVVPAFVSRRDAIQMQQRLEENGKQKYVRVGQDFSTFLKTIQSFADKKLPVVVFGYSDSDDDDDQAQPNSAATSQLPMRTWKSATGKYTVEARFVSLEDGVLKLQRESGKTLTVPINKLAAADQDYAKSLAAEREMETEKGSKQRGAQN